MGWVPDTPPARTLKEKTADKATEWAFAAGWGGIRLLPEKSAYKMFDQFADHLHRKHAPDVTQLERNLMRVHPELSKNELDALTKASLRSYMRYWCSAFRLQSLGPKRLQNEFQLEGDNYIVDARKAGTGIILVGSHSGNWDMAGAWAAQNYDGITAVGERLKPEALFQRFLEFRVKLGVEVLPLGECRNMQVMTDRLHENRIVALVGDRDISRHGIVVNFMGSPASFPAGPAILGIDTGVPVHPLSMWFDGHISKAKVHPQIPVPQTGSRQEQIAVMTQQVADALAGGIREHAVDWHMMQAVWLEDFDQTQVKVR